MARDTVTVTLSRPDATHLLILLPRDTAVALDSLLDYDTEAMEPEHMGAALRALADALSE